MNTEITRCKTALSLTLVCLVVTIITAFSNPAMAGGFPKPERLTADFNLGDSLIIPDLADADCNLIQAWMDPETELYLIEFNAAIQIFLGLKNCELEDLTQAFDPAGDPILLGDFLMASGEVSITCTAMGTRYNFQFRNLIPNGLYTIWHFPGSGGGALASHPGDINNVFVANQQGNANLNVLGTPGPMTFGGAVGPCTLPTVENVGGGFVDELFVVLYHNDQMAHGPISGPPDTILGHLQFFVE